MAEPRDVVIVSPSQRVTQSLKTIINQSKPTTVVVAISELNGLITAESAGSMGLGKNYSSLRKVDFSGQNWHYDSGEDFCAYVERQLRDVNKDMVREMIEGHHSTLVIDLEQLIGNRKDVIGVYNIVSFGNWRTQNRVPRLVFPTEMKAILGSRLQGDGS